MDYLEQLERENKVFIIRPKNQVKVSRAEKTEKIIQPIRRRCKSNGKFSR